MALFVQGKTRISSPDYSSMVEFPGIRDHANTPANGSRNFSAAAAGTRSLDPRDLAHLVIEGLFGLIFPDSHARLRLGLKAISRRRQETPAWYLWTTSRLGVCEVGLLPVLPEDPAGALLALRYFPDPRETVFTRFAPIEQQARLSPRFDHTGTPLDDAADGVDPSLFHIGTLLIVPQGADHIGLRLDAQDRWIEQAREQGNWRKRRDVPGLRLALAVLDPLVCGLSYLGRQPPALVQAWRRTGVAWDIEANGDADCRAEANAWRWEIDLHGLLVPGRAGAAGRMQAARRAAEPPLFEHADEVQPQHAPWPINPQWWQAAGWKFDPVGAFCSHCGAEGDHHEQISFPAATRSKDDEQTA